MLNEFQNSTPTAKFTYRIAFSLVELSIVLVILGLLTGGILTGQSLIRAAELRNLTGTFEIHQTALNTFLDKYRQFPGDMRNATDFFGAAVTCPPTSPLTGRETCNGDGDNQLEWRYAHDGYTDPGTFAWEIALYFHHLSSSGIISGAYDGFTALPGVGFQELTLKRRGMLAAGSGGNTLHHPSYKSDLQIVNNIDGTIIFYGLDATRISSGFFRGIHGALISPREAWNIENKIDDGNPQTGKLRIFNERESITGDCLATNTSTNDSFNLTKAETILCNFAFIAFE